MGMLEFGKFNGKFDIQIRGLGVDALVSEVRARARNLWSLTLCADQP